MTLAGKLNIHLALEDDALYPRLMSHSDPKLRDLATRFSGEMSGIKPAFQGYVARWSESAIRGDAAAFAEETKTLLAALGDRIQRENTELYPAVDSLG